MFKVNSIFNWFSVGVVFGKTALLMLHFCTLKCSFVGIGYKKEEHAFEILQKMLSSRLFLLRKTDICLA